MSVLGLVPALGLVVVVLVSVAGVDRALAGNGVRTDRAQVVAIGTDLHQERAKAAGQALATGVAPATAAERRTAAVKAAQAALDEADAVVAAAAKVVGQQTIKPLLTVTAKLAALVEQAPHPVSVIGARAVTDVAPAASRASGATRADAPADRQTEVAEQDPAAIPTVGILAATGASPSAPELDSAAILRAATVLDAIDVKTSVQLIQVTAQVTELSKDVRQAAERAEAVRAAAARSARSAARLARKISVAIASPNGDIPLHALCPVSFDRTTLLRCDAAADLELLNEAFRARFGRNLSVSSSYRDYDGQIVAKRTRGELAATPGTSNHGRGLAVDLEGFGEVGQFDRATYIWMSSHARHYGWLHPSCMKPGGSGPLEPWHWEYRTE